MNASDFALLLTIAVLAWSTLTSVDRIAVLDPDSPHQPESAPSWPESRQAVIVDVVWWKRYLHSDTREASKSSHLTAAGAEDAT